MSGDWKKKKLFNVTVSRGKGCDVSGGGGVFLIFILLILSANGSEGSHIFR